MENLIVDLPDIIDIDSEIAFIDSYKVMPEQCTKVVRVLSSKSKVDNKL
jgi:hypothetical protein